MAAMTLTHPRVTAARIADRAKRFFLMVREEHLDHRPPRDVRTYRTRRRIAAGLAQPFELVLEQSVFDLADGAPLAAVLRPYQHIIAALVTLASEPTPSVLARPLTLLQREMRAQCAYDEAQLAVLDNPDNADALMRALARSSSYDLEQNRFDAWARERLARLDLRPDSLATAAL